MFCDWENVPDAEKVGILYVQNIERDSCLNNLKSWKVGTSIEKIVDITRSRFSKYVQNISSYSCFSQYVNYKEPIQLFFFFRESNLGNIGRDKQKNIIFLT